MSNYIDADDCRNKLRDDFDGLYELPAEQDDLTDDIANIEALADSYIGKRYAVPITNATALSVIKPICLDLFAERAYQRGSGPELTQKVKDAALEARRVLKDLALGVLTLAGAEGLSERPSGGADAIIVDGNTPEFTRTDLEGY